jgi:hypothetical protein
VFAAESILLKTISPLSHSTVYFIGAIIDDITGDVLKYQLLMKMDKHKQVWAHSFANETGRLFQGIRNVPGIDTCFFIAKSHVPAHKRPTYGQICCNYRPQREEKHRVSLTIGDNRIDYSGNKSTPTANLTTTKLLINTTTSTPGAMFLGFNLANYYLHTPMPNPKYMLLCLNIIPNKSLPVTTFAALSLLTAGYTSRFERGCMVFPKPASLQINYLKSALPPKGTTNANIQLVSGATSGKTSHSA